MNLLKGITHISLRTLSIALIFTFVFFSLLLLAAVFFLGGINLFLYLRTTLIQGLGLGIAATASLFFFLRVVWRLHAVSMGIAMIFFVIGVLMFISVSMGTLYSMQYPVFVNSFGPGQGPGLPIANVLAFFRNIDKYPVIKDIARDPNDVPAPITISNGLIIGEASSTANMSTSTHDVMQMVATGTVPLSGNKIDKVYLETDEVLSEIAPGVTYNYWTFNNTVPGPMLRVKEGDIVEVTIYNNANNLHQHNVDFHAASGPGGGGAVSVVSPGETKTFRFKALHPGLFVYHCAVPNMAEHMAHGMYGMIIVEPKEGMPKVDKEFYLMEGDLYTVGALGRTGLQIFDAQKMMDGNPSYITFNGRSGALNGKMEAKVGDKIRMYVGNASVSYQSSFHIVGEIFDTVYPEASIGGALFHNVQTTNIPAGGAAIVEFTVDYPGDYTIVDHALMRTDKGAWGVLHVTGDADPSIFDGNFTKEMPMKM